jgi:hypothetical protein
MAFYSGTVVSSPFSLRIYVVVNTIFNEEYIVVG